MVFIGVIRVSDIKLIQQKIILLHNQFVEVIKTNNGSINVSAVAKLDHHVSTLLTPLNLQPALKLQLNRELMALKSSHGKVLEICKQQSEHLSELMSNHTSNREGIMAYREVEL